jgi:hypothetical protein
MRKKTLEPDMPLTSIWRMRTACRVTKATNIYNIASPLQQQIQERALIFRIGTLSVLLNFSTEETLSVFGYEFFKNLRYICFLKCLINVRRINVSILKDAAARVRQFATEYTHVQVM